MYIQSYFITNKKRRYLNKRQRITKEQSRETVNIGYTKHKTKTNNPEKLSTLDTQDEDKQSRETVNIRYTRHKTKTNNPEKLSTLDTQNARRRQTKQKTQHITIYANKQKYREQDMSPPINNWRQVKTNRIHFVIQCKKSLKIIRKSKTAKQHNDQR